ncbi:hypothetical protein EMO89_01700 [Bifidobacterium tissieri]|uniref:Siphovirus ReqiPepy6 Gp37-like protein n=1 Tax=Bifidobacterium tissieri TaxID=1630162 RepID=A0A5M9ZVE2_9BIFI|nr:hypothetical protein [Bifidobacterium tissieri]KAA8831475.1 hypothetical protein EMO89_01700 [Bifidobacterium tissieri]
MVDIVITDARQRPKWVVEGASLDLAYGSDENSFKLDGLNVRPEAGALVMIDGTEYGGRITKLNTDGSVEGPTWHGILADRIIQPDAGADYYVVSGDAGTVLETVLQRIGLSPLYSGSAPTRADLRIDRYQFARYVDAYTGLRAMLASVGAKLILREIDGVVRAMALPIDSYGDAIDSDLLDFDGQRDTQPVNHLIGLGDGELRDRAVVHRYADAAGNVSGTQSITGLDERVAVYDYSNAKADELAVETEKKLRELQPQGGITATLRGYNGLEFDVGDQITGRDNRLGITVTATVAKKIVKVSHGILTVSYECGTASGGTTSMSGSAESSTGGTSGGGSGSQLLAGDGIEIRGNRIYAEVTQAKLDTVQTLAETAQKTASDFSAQIGQAQQDAKTAVDTANESVRTLNGTTPIHVWRSEDKASATVYADTASGTTDGLMSSTDKVKLDGIEAGATRIIPDGVSITMRADGTISAHTTDDSGKLIFPVGYILMNSTGENPGDTFGGTWEEQPSLGPYLWLRTR